MPFDIPDEEKIIFAAYDKVYKTAYRLEEGIRNAALDLIIHFSPILGNPIEIKKA